MNFILKISLFLSILIMRSIAWGVDLEHCALNMYHNSALKIEDARKFCTDVQGSADYQHCAKNMYHNGGLRALEAVQFCKDTKANSESQFCSIKKYNSGNTAQDAASACRGNSVSTSKGFCEFNGKSQKVGTVLGPYICGEKGIWLNQKAITAEVPIGVNTSHTPKDKNEFNNDSTARPTSTSASK